MSDSASGDIAKEIVRRNTERVQGQGDFDLFETLFADDFIDHTPQPGTTADKDGFRVLYQRLRAAFPDFRPEIHWQTVDGDVVTIEPTGRVVRFETVDAMRVRRGQIAEHWRVANLYSVVHQLGGRVES
ncbi:ester cyclase [Mycobacterium sp. D16R24]|uniref:ester cyclase n=1 Tax=Mycobacterium sp. D16R24 TaxID=1855656 RepID=UPI000993B35D|nr:ester cyclase [Mycobacterium sp. D16R24]